MFTVCSVNLCAPVYGGHYIGSHCLSQTWGSTVDNYSIVCTYCLHKHIFASVVSCLCLSDNCIWQLSLVPSLCLKRVEFRHCAVLTCTSESSSTVTLNAPLTGTLKFGLECCTEYCWANALLWPALVDQHHLYTLFAHSFSSVYLRAKQLVWQCFHQHLHCAMYPCCHNESESYSPLHPLSQLQQAHIASSWRALRENHHHL